MNKAELIERYGDTAYEEYKERARERSKKYREKHPGEANAYRNGIIDVIVLLDGEITVLTEEEVKNNGKKNDFK